MWNYPVLVAAIAIVPALLVFLVTKSWLPRVSDFALGVMAVSLGTLALWMAFSSLQEGVFKGAVASKILSHDVYLAKSPGAFWTYFALFALPGLLLVIVPVCIALLGTLAHLRGKKRT